MHEFLLGRVLVEQGQLSATQVDELLALQATDRRRLGMLATERFGVAPEVISEAVVELHRRRSPEVRLATEPFDPQCLHLFTPQQAWDHLVMPLRVADGELIIATTEETLASAIDVVDEVTHRPYRFVLAEIRPLEQFIAERYSFEGVDCIEAA